MHDSTDYQIANTRHVDWVPGAETGYPEDGESIDTVDGLCGLGTREFPDHLHVPESEWKDRARDNDKYGTWPEDFRARHLHQGQSHECVAHSFCHNFEIARNKQRSSLQDAVWMSPLHLYSRCNGNRWGGTYLQKALGIAMEQGLIPEHDGPDGEDTQKHEFKHTLHQTSGRGDGWVSVRDFPNGWEETARWFKPLEVVNIRHWTQVVSILLNGWAVCVGRWGHAICYTSVVWSNGELMARYADSYRVHRSDTVRAIKAGIGGAYSIMSTVVPDDWSKPAG